ncbi:YdcF family protein [bacterium]|nr:YdcF family protein [bacterium]
MFLFLFKKFVSPFFFPLPLCIGIIGIGLVLLWFSRKQVLGKVLVTSGTILLFLLGYNPTADILLRPLEYFHAPLDDMEQLHGIKWIVVLGGGHSSDPNLPKLSQVSQSSLARLIEAVRLHMLYPESKIILSGGGFWDPVPHAQLLADIARSIGVSDQDLVLETESYDTKDEAQYIHSMVKQDRFILITSASHMPRSVSLFEGQGMSPIPDPIEHLVKKRTRFSPILFFPDGTGLVKSQRAIYEYLGLAWAKLRGQI